MNFHEKPDKTRGPFTAAELARRTGDVLHAAALGPVAITKNGKSRFVIMSKETFDRINPQKSYRTDDMPEEILEWLLPALERAANGEGYDD
jgi:prevent-host-death family protein